MNTCSIRHVVSGLLLALTSTAAVQGAPAAGEDGSAYVWTGVRGNIGRAARIEVEPTRYASEDPSVARRARPDEHVSRLRAELAELRLADATEGPAPDHESARLELWIRACDDEPFAGQGELLVELALARAESLAARGAIEAALAATHELLVPARLVAQAGEFELREADAAWLERAAAWLADPALVALRAKLAPPQEAQAAAGDVDVVIEGHLAEGNVQAVLQFGARAVTVAERYILEHPSEYRALDMDDPLTVLFRLDEERGARFALDHLDDSGAIFGLRVLRSMRAARVLDNEGTWNFVQERKGGVTFQHARLIQPVWRELLERLVQQGELASDAFREIGFLVQMDALSPELAKALEAAIRGSDPTRHQKAMTALKEAGWRESARALMTRLLDHPSPQVRGYMADRLSTFDECRELWRLVDDPSPEVRRAVADSLRPGRVRVLEVPSTQNSHVRETTETSLRGLDRGGLVVLESLLADGESTVYLQAMDILLEILNKHPTLEPSIETLRSLTDHPDARMRRLLPRCSVAGRPDPRILEALADDEDLDVRFAVDAALRTTSELGPYPQPDRPLKEGWQVFAQASSRWTDEFLPALVRRLSTSPNLPESLGPAPFVACHTAAGARALAEVARDTRQEGVRLGLVDSLALKTSAFGNLRGWHLVEPDLARDVLSHAWRAVPDAQRWTAVSDAFRLGPASYPTACLRWSADESLPWAVRLLALRVSQPLADEAWCARLTELVRLAGQDDGHIRGWNVAFFNLAREIQDRALASRYLSTLVADRALHEEFLIPLVSGLCRIAVPDPATARAALDRWCEAGDSYFAVVELSLLHVAATEQAPDVELFERLLRVDHEDVVPLALAAMGRLHLRAHLPLLERALQGEFGANAQMRSLAQRHAAGALASYLDDHAAELLLRGLGATSDGGVRDACFAALDTIRRYQDERARWNSRSDTGRARAETIAELVGLIESGDAAQKVEAVRALGTLEAFEELPRLVRLAGSRDVALAKAAKEALERIHAARK